VLHKTLQLLGLSADDIYVHVLSKGTNVHSETEVASMERMVEENKIERVVVLDQGSRPGKIVGNLSEGGSALLLIDHHQSEEVITGKFSHAHHVVDDQNMLSTSFHLMRSS
jgi:nanoRNase/pAp phosphatase (c-di-AMP/oligoRNAs hydrolase)